MLNDGKKLKVVCITALGIALYVALSMTAKVPLIGNIGLDLGYIVLAVFAYHCGWVSGAAVGAVGCSFVSLLTSGWFPPGWVMGNILIGIFCGNTYEHDDCKESFIWNISMSVFAVFLGIAVIKTAVECVMFDIPLAVKVPKNIVAAVIDAITMCVGVYIAQMIERRNNQPKNNGRSVAQSAIRKLAQKETDPFKYTDEELSILAFIVQDKCQKLDISFVDVKTPYGLSRLSDALYLHKSGYKYYINKLVFGEV